MEGADTNTARGAMVNRGKVLVYYTSGIIHAAGSTLSEISAGRGQLRKIKQKAVNHYVHKITEQKKKGYAI